MTERKAHRINCGVPAFWTHPNILEVWLSGPGKNWSSTSSSAARTSGNGMMALVMIVRVLSTNESGTGSLVLDNFPMYLELSKFGVPLLT